MLIGIDGNEANIKERVGVNVWAFEILKGISKLINDTPSNRLTHQLINSLTHRVIVYLKRSPLVDLPPETDRWRYRVVPDAPLWTRWRLPLDLYVHGFKGSDLSGRSDPSDSRRPDVFLSLSHYAPKFAPMPRIVSIMDLSFLHFPEAFKPLVRWQLQHWTRESVRNATHVLTISEFTKKEIVRVYGYSEEKITVVYPGISETFRAFKGLSLDAQGQSLRNVRRQYGITGKYILFIGTLQPKKNLPRLLEAFKIVRKDFPDIQLVIAGKIWSQFSSEKYQILPSMKVSDTFNIRYLGFVPNEDISPLISGAECLVLPSLYEGFGIPVLEAMALGTPVAASNTTSIPEVTGDCGVLFDPTSVPDIARGIREVLSWNDVKRREQVKKGMMRAETFSWEEGAEKVLRMLEEIGMKRQYSNKTI